MVDRFTTQRFTTQLYNKVVKIEIIHKIGGGVVNRIKNRKILLSVKKSGKPPIIMIYVKI